MTGGKLSLAISDLLILIAYEIPKRINKIRERERERINHIHLTPPPREKRNERLIFHYSHVPLDASHEWRKET